MKTFLNNWLYPILFSITILGLGLCALEWVSGDPIKQKIEIVPDDVRENLKERDVFMITWDALDKGYQTHKKSRFDTTEPIYQLTTKFDDDEFEDYGTEKYIDSIKCIRYAEAVKQIKQFELKKEKEKLGLERLVKKTCK